MVPIIIDFEKREVFTPLLGEAMVAMSKSRTSAGNTKWYKDFCWLNLEGREDVCDRCGQSGHPARRCVHDMPPDVKESVLGRKIPMRKDPEAHFVELTGLETYPVDSIFPPTAHSCSRSSSDSSVHSWRSPSSRGGRRSTSYCHSNQVLGGMDQLTNGLVVSDNSNSVCYSTF